MHTSMVCESRVYCFRSKICQKNDKLGLLGYVFFSAFVVWNGFSSTKQTGDIDMFPLPAMLKTFTNQENIEMLAINIRTHN